MTIAEFTQLWPSIKEKPVKVLYGYVNPTWLHTDIFDFKVYTRWRSNWIYLRTNKNAKRPGCLTLRAVRKIELENE